MSEQVQLMEWDDEARILLRTEIESYRQRVFEEAKRQASLRHPKARYVSVTTGDVREAFWVARCPHPRKRDA